MKNNNIEDYKTVPDPPLTRSSVALPSLSRNTQLDRVRTKENDEEADETNTTVWPAQILNNTSLNSGEKK